LLDAGGALSARTARQVETLTVNKLGRRVVLRRADVNAYLAACRREPFDAA
jgi:hypothetical protein